MNKGNKNYGNIYRNSRNGRIMNMGLKKSDSFEDNLIDF
jgi:hypothetical protein